MNTGRLARGVIRAFDGGTFRASVEVVGSREVVLADVQVSKGLSAASVAVGAACVVAFLSEHDPKDAVVLAIM